MCGGEPICRLVIDRKLLLQRQAVEVCPSLAKPHLQMEFIAVQYEAKTFVRRILLATSVQRQGRGQRYAEPNIDEVRTILQIDTQQHMASGWDYAGRSAPVYPRCQASGAKTEREQHIEQ